MAQVVNFHIKCIEAAGLKWSLSKKKWAKWVTSFDLTKKNGFRYVGSFIKDIEYLNPPSKPVIILCCSYVSDIKAKYRVVVWDGKIIHRTTIETEAGQWAMDIFDKVNELYDLVGEGLDWSGFIDSSPLPVEADTESQKKKEPEFGVVKITPTRKELIEAIIELSSKCPGMGLWSTLLVAVGDKKDEDISDESLIDLVFDYTMTIAGESLTLD